MALLYLDRGWRPIPIDPQGKAALVKWKEFTDRAPTREEIDRWWRKQPDANVAILTGSGSGIVAVDIDSAEGERAFEEAFGEVVTPTNVTAKGRHLLFRHPGTPLGNRVRFIDGIDIRGDAGYIVAPPSLHPSGTRYRWDEREGRGVNCDLAPLPDGFSEQLAGTTHQDEEAQRESDTLADAFTLPDSIAEGTRNDTLARYAGHLLSRGLDHDRVLGDCKAVNANRCVPPLGDKEVERTVRSIWQRHTGSQPDPRSGNPVTRRLCDIEPQRVEWLWRDYIPKGKLTVLDGDPGLGKSTLTLDIAARVSTGRKMPDGASCEPAGVVLLNTEDGLDDTVVPRLRSADADLSRIEVLTEVKDASGVGRHPTIPEDLHALKQVIERTGAALVIVDPITAYLSGSVNSWSDQDVRRALAPLALLADETGAAIVLVRHLNKKPGQPAMYRGGGSIGIIGAARSGLVVAKHPDDAERRVLAQVKNNLAKHPRSLSFRIESFPDGSSGIQWEGAVDLTADDLFAAKADRPSKRDEAKAFLQERLSAAAAVPSTVLNDLAVELGISLRTLKRAEKEIGVKKSRTGFGPGSAWMASLPSEQDHVEEEGLASFDDSPRDGTEDRG